MNFKLHENGNFKTRMLLCYLEQVFEVGKAFFYFKIYKFYVWNKYFKFGMDISSLKYILPVQNE